MMWVLIHFIAPIMAIISVHIKAVVCIECHSCQYSDTDTWQGYSCVSDPDTYREGPSVVECPRNVDACYSYVEFYPDRRAIKYAYRGCSDRTKIEECAFVGAELHCTYTCSHSNRCNTDDLIQLKPDLLRRSPAPSGPRRRYGVTTPQTARAPTPTHSSDYFLCYSCTYNYNPHADDSCVTSPADEKYANTVICRKDGEHACVTRRQFALGENVIRSFYRGCELVDKSTKDFCEKDLHFNTCFTYCRGELCNGAESAVDDIKDTKSKDETKKMKRKEQTLLPGDDPEVPPTKRRTRIGRHRIMAQNSAAKAHAFQLVHLVQALLLMVTSYCR